ncbi:uncharacterized protein LAESUDRAFT_632117, partial [Laetiporus sulphureus 93-53]
PRLVDDLIPVILENHDHWWARDLTRLALVSHAWLEHCRKRLYECPSLRTYEACDRLVEALTKNPQLTSLIRAIDLQPLSDNAAMPSPKTMYSIRFILGIRGLQRLTLGGHLAVEAERFLHAVAHVDTVRQLSIVGSADCFPRSDHCSPVCKCNASLEWDEVLASKFHRLNSLRLVGLQLSIPLPPMLSHRLHTLYLHDVDMADGSFIDLCHGSWSALRCLDVSTSFPEETADGIRVVIAQCANLEVLRYQVLSSRAQATFLDDGLPHCPSMREVHLSGTRITSASLRSIAQAYRNLERFALLGHDSRVNADEWVAFVASDELPFLRRLTTPHGTMYPPFKCWPAVADAALVEVCRTRNIKLVS